MRHRVGRGAHPCTAASRIMYKIALNYLQAELLFWAVAITVMVADDAAMMAMMFC